MLGKSLRKFTPNGLSVSRSILRLEVQSSSAPKCQSDNNPRPPASPTAATSASGTFHAIGARTTETSTPKIAQYFVCLARPYGSTNCVLGKFAYRFGDQSRSWLKPYRTARNSAVAKFLAMASNSDFWGACRTHDLTVPADFCASDSKTFPSDHPPYCSRAPIQGVDRCRRTYLVEAVSNHRSQRHRRTYG